jgi:hypothetical protein
MEGQTMIDNATNAVAKRLILAFFGQKRRIIKFLPLAQVRG